MGKQQIDDLTLEPFRVELLIFRHLRESGRSSNWILLGIPIVLALMIGGAALDGRLLPSSATISVVDTIRYDFLHLIGKNNGEKSLPNFPLLRDTASLIVACLQILNIAVIYRQWSAFSNFMTRLSASGTLRVRPAHRHSVKVAIATQNTFYKRLEKLSVVVLLGCIVASVFLYNGLDGTSLFRQFSPDSKAATYCILPSSAAGNYYNCSFQSWWATGGFGKWVFGGLSALFFYYLILQNLLGFRMCRFLIEIRNAYLLEPSPIKQDCFGLTPIGDVLRSVYLSISINLFSLVTLVGVVQGNEAGNLSPSLAVFALATVIYGFVPLFVLRGIKVRTESRLMRFYRIFPNKTTEHALGRLELVPLIPLKTRPFQILLLGILPACVASYQIYVWLVAPSN